MAALLWGASAELGACGGQEKVVAAPAAAKVVWSNAGAPDEASSESSEAEPEKAPAETAAAAKPSAPEPPAEASPTEDGAIDLDELAASKERAAAAEREPAAPAASDPVAAELQRRRSEKARKAGKAKTGTKKARAEEPASEAEAAASAYSGSDPCRAASFSVPRVREACSNGGRPAAKRVMKDAIGKATATGQMLKCGDCHANQRDYSLRSNAVRDLKRWLDG
jgi:hypothetical protein